MKDIEMTAQMLAEHMGWSRFKAHREFARIEAEHPGVIERRGGRLFARASRLAPHVPGWKPTPLEREVTILRNRIGELEARVDAEARTRAEFQRKAMAWFARYDVANVRKQEKESPTVTGG